MRAFLLFLSLLRERAILFFYNSSRKRSEPVTFSEKHRRPTRTRIFTSENDLFGHRITGIFMSLRNTRLIQIRATLEEINNSSIGMSMRMRMHGNLRFHAWCLFFISHWTRASSLQQSRALLERERSALNYSERTKRKKAPLYLSYYFVEETSRWHSCFG